jgi:hypothetical protein
VARSIERQSVSKPSQHSLFDTHTETQKKNAELFDALDAWKYMAEARMNTALCSQCLDAFERALHSPIGQALECQFTAQFPNCDPAINLFRIRARLFDRYYQSFDHYFTDLSETVSACVRFVGEDHDIAIAIETVYQLICDESASIVNGDGSGWRSALSDFAAAINQAISPIPESREGYNDWVQKTVRPEIAHELRKPHPTNPAHIDVFQLKAMIQRLAKDEDHHELVTIVQRFEPEFAGISEVVELDIRKCRPETLVINFQGELIRASTFRSQVILTNCAIAVP